MATPVFNSEKSLQAVLYIANRVERKDFHKIFKVLYIADREHLIKYGRPITGDTYIAMKDGPVPSKIDDIFKAVRGDSYFAKYADIAKFSELFSVHDWYFILPKKEANLYYLSKTDIAELDDSIAKYGSMAWEELREKSHDYAWHATAKDRPIAVADIMREDGADEEFINHVTSLMDFQKACL